MHKKDIFDLYNEQHKNDPAPENDTMPGEVRPEDVAPAQEVTPAPEPKPEPKQEPAPELPRDPEPKQEGGTANGT